MAFLNIMILLLTSAIFTTRGDFPRNSKPKTVINLSDVEAQIFTGDDVRAENRLRRLQLIKRIRIGQNEFLAVASRDHLYFINPDKLGGKNSGKIQYDNVITWKSDNTTKELCSMKGKPKELCHNFLSVVETTNDQGSEILVCGSNSFSPICTTYAVSVLSSGLALLRGDDFSGKQRCPFGPDQRSAAIFTGGSLYAGTYQAFTGVSPVVSRTMGEKAPLKTPTTDV
uniref:Sema domain-containing protein n=1 Tax=Ciona savignyi TaxID=51511 RepID=H2Y5I3_CIOSA